MTRQKDGPIRSYSAVHGSQRRDTRAHKTWLQPPYHAFGRSKRHSTYSALRYLAVYVCYFMNVPRQRSLVSCVVGCNNSRRIVVTCDGMPASRRQMRSGAPLLNVQDGDAYGMSSERHLLDPGRQRLPGGRMKLGVGWRTLRRRQSLR
jgi:hypothetical protein